MKIQIEEYNPDWVEQFTKLERELSSTLKLLKPKIEHVGSTSIPNLAAKPIIDILVGIQSTSDLDKTIEPMINNQYIYYEVYNKVMPQRRLYVGLKNKSDSYKFQKIYSHNEVIPHQDIHDHRLSHIHIWQFGTYEWARHIAFRDYLKKHPEVKKQYEILKIKLSKKEWIDGNEYNKAKDGFIKVEEEKAISWYNKLKKC